ncbi:MAG: sugar kinase [Alphaproteobacteria bacterium]
MADLICLGEAMVELNQQTNGQYAQGFGGDTSNCAVAAARAGANVEAIGALGQDFFGQQISDLWQTENIANQNIYRDSTNPTGLYLVTHDDAGHHFHYYRKGSAASLYGADQLPKDAIKNAKILHVSGISLAISDIACKAVYAAIEVAKDNGVAVSFDTNLRLKLWPLSKAQRVINDVAAMADYLLPGLDDAQLLTNLETSEDICAYYHDLGTKNIALTLGAEGVYLSQDGAGQLINGRKVKAVDATGAGDTFDGNFLARILAGDSLVEATNYANVAASIAVQGYGAIAPMPTQKQVMEIMNAQ